MRPLSSYAWLFAQSWKLNDSFYCIGHSLTHPHPPPPHPHPDTHTHAEMNEWIAVMPVSVREQTPGVLSGLTDDNEIFLLQHRPWRHSQL